MLRSFSCAWASVDGLGEHAQPAPNRSARPKSSMLFATQTVQVTSEAIARPIMTVFTMVSACRNMPQGERSCGSCARLTDAPPAAGVAEVAFVMLVSELGVAAFAGASGASAAGAGEAPPLEGLSP